jgi:hypothetical protein
MIKKASAPVNRTIRKPNFAAFYTDRTKFALARAVMESLFEEQLERIGKLLSVFAISRK